MSSSRSKTVREHAHAHTDTHTHTYTHIYTRIHAIFSFEKLQGRDNMGNV
jgi:hypothetical protein